MVNIVNNYDLYDKYSPALDFAKTLMPFKTESKMVFHFYWRVPMEFGRKQALTVKSLIANHYEVNGGNIEVNMWSNVDLSDNPYLSPIKEFINIKVWDPIEEVKGTILEPYIDYYKQSIRYDPKNWIAGDFFRLLCLHKYGGFYFDMDVLILRDLSPLSKYQFLYQWGSSGTTKEEPSIFFNGAVMRLEKNSQASIKFLAQTLQIPSSESTNWSSVLYSRVEDKDLNYFPCAWFNTEWMLKDPNYNFQPFKSDSDKNLFDGAFTWHWHNKWEEEIEEDCKFSILEKIIEEKISGILQKEVI